MAYSISDAQCATLDLLKNDNISEKMAIIDNFNTVNNLAPLQITDVNKVYNILFESPDNNFDDKFDGEECLWIGIKLQLRNEYSRAISYYNFGIQKGNSDAANKLGKYHYIIKKDLEKAKQYFLLGKQMGNLFSAFNVATMHVLDQNFSDANNAIIDAFKMLITIDINPYMCDIIASHAISMVERMKTSENKLTLLKYMRLAEILENKYDENTNFINEYKKMYLSDRVAAARAIICTL